MMKAFEIFYLSIYFAVRKDKNWSKTERVTYLIETVLFMLCSSFLFILLGVINLRDFKIIIFLIFIALIGSAVGGKVFLGKGKEQEYIKSGNNYDLKKKRILAVWGILLFILSFVVMILSAILMSYLWSIDLFR
jgi:membrane protein YdbS with pleckstrin-like domain